MEDDLGFSFQKRKSGEILISRWGSPVTTLRGPATVRFERLLRRLGEQQAMARVTGNYRRRKERDRPPT
jgi:hypothetical protein